MTKCIKNVHKLELFALILRLYAEEMYFRSQFCWFHFRLMKITDTIRKSNIDTSPLRFKNKVFICVHGAYMFFELPKGCWYSPQPEHSIILCNNYMYMVVMCLSFIITNVMYYTWRISKSFALLAFSQSLRYDTIIQCILGNMYYITGVYITGVSTYTNKTQINWHGTRISCNF